MIINEYWRMGKCYTDLEMTKIAEPGDPVALVEWICLEDLVVTAVEGGPVFGLDPIHGAFLEFCEKK